MRGRVPDALSGTAAEGWLRPLLNVSDMTDDNDWAEVTRMRAGCMTGDRIVNGEAYAEGLTTWGHDPNGDGANYSVFLKSLSLPPAAADSTAAWPYGCWFMHAARGSGILVNMRRSLRVSSRDEAHLRLGLPANVGDKLYCYIARQLGFDSIQFAQAHVYGRVELLICYGGCVSEAVRGACPPVPLQHHGASANRTCDCDNRSTVLNCGHGRKAATSGNPWYAHNILSGCVQALHHSQWLYDQACRQGRFDRCILRRGGYR